MPRQAQLDRINRWLELHPVMAWAVAVWIGLAVLVTAELLRALARWIGGV